MLKNQKNSYLHFLIFASLSGMQSKHKLKLTIMYKKTTLKHLSQFLKKAFPVFAFLAISFGNVKAQYPNGVLGTGTVSKSGVSAPAGTQWHEMQNDAGNTTPRFWEVQGLQMTLQFLQGKFGIYPN
jgi:hypothetical protein